MPSSVEIFNFWPIWVKRLKFCENDRPMSTSFCENFSSLANLWKELASPKLRQNLKRSSNLQMHFLNSNFPMCNRKDFQNIDFSSSNISTYKHLLYYFSIFRALRRCGTEMLHKVWCFLVPLSFSGIHHFLCTILKFHSYKKIKTFGP